jgi:hypothetical protein
MMRLSVRVTPGAATTVVAGTHGDGASAPLRVRVAARAVDGAANAAVIAAVAEALGVRRSAVRIVRGAGSRSKLLEVDVEPGVIEARIEALRGG